MQPVLNKLIKLIMALLLGLSVPGAAAHKPNIAIVATGGTIAGAGRSETNAGYEPAVLPVERLLKAVPELAAIATVTGVQVFQIASQDMTDQHWLTLARTVDELLDTPAVDGVVITHGTDTMEETAYFLNLVIHSKKPVVLTGAMRPPTSLSADGPLNLYNAVAVAANPISAGKGVLIAMNETILGAREAAKTSTTSPATFQAPVYGALGQVYYGAVHIYRQSTRRHTWQSEFSIGDLQELPRVDIIYGHANNNAAHVNASVRARAAGLVSAGVGNGNQQDVTLKALIRAAGRGIMVVRSSRTGSGRVTLGAEVDDDKYGFIVADNLSPQKSRILLMLALIRTRDRDEIQRMFFEY
jgi:L-asparaginase